MTHFDEILDWTLSMLVHTAKTTTTKTTNTTTIQFNVLLGPYQK